MFLWGVVGIIIFQSSNRVLQSTLLPLSSLDIENNNNTMTVLTLEQQELDHVEVVIEEQDQETSPSLAAHPMPSWVPELRSDWGEAVVVDEWQQDDGTYRAKHGWQVRPLGD